MINIKNKLIVIVLILFTILLVTKVYIFKYTKIDNRLSFSNGTYIVSGREVILKNGLSEIEEVEGSQTKIITKYFGNEVKGDFNKDGREDLAFLITQETGGSGTFFYLVALLNTERGLKGTEAVYIGDRIAPQTTQLVKENIVLVNYADRNPGESFATQPSLGKSIWLLLNPKTLQFGEVVQNFESEADPSRMTLQMKTWVWIKTLYSDGKVFTPKLEKKFTLTLKNGGTFSATTDCNGIGGEYSVSSNRITFNKMLSTLMYCEGSQESDFSKALQETESYLFTSKGELVFSLKLDSGSMIFR